MNFTRRSLFKMFVLMILTLGIYVIYWLVVTKRELNTAGAHIPTAWLIIIPFVNLYFLYKFAQGFTTFILEKRTYPITLLLVMLINLPITVLVSQWYMNKISQ